MPTYSRPVLATGYQVSWPAVVGSVSIYGGARVRREFVGGRPVANVQWKVPADELVDDLAFFDANAASDITLNLIVDDPDVQAHTVRLIPDSIVVRDHTSLEVTITAEAVVTPLAADTELDTGLVMLFDEYLDEPDVLEIIATLETVVGTTLMAGL